MLKRYFYTVNNKISNNFESNIIKIPKINTLLMAQILYLN